MARKKKLQTYVSDALYKYLERSARDSKTSVSLEAARLLETLLQMEGTGHSPQAQLNAKRIEELSINLQSLQRRVVSLEDRYSVSNRLDPSRRGRRAK